MGCNRGALRVGDPLVPLLGMQGLGVPCMGGERATLGARCLHGEGETGGVLEQRMGCREVPGGRKRGVAPH